VCQCGSWVDKMLRVIVLSASCLGSYLVCCYFTQGIWFIGDGGVCINCDSVGSLALCGPGTNGSSLSYVGDIFKTC
jgi:hypothetical protein